MAITSNTLAAAVAVGVQNKTFKAGAGVLSRKILAIGTPLAAKASGVAMAIPQLILSPEDAKDRYGAGSCLARIVEKAFVGANYGVPIYAFPEAEIGGAVAATGSIAVVVTTAVAGKLYLYVAGKLYEIAVTAGETATAIGDAIVAALAADDDCPVTGINTTGTVALTAKSKGPYGNGITVEVNQDPQADQVLPGGVSVTITDMHDGAGLPTLAVDLAAGLGSGSAANADGFTDVCHGYGQDATALSALSAYVGEGNTFTGLYDRLVARPFRSLVGDVATGSSGLSNLITFTGNRKLDRCSGVIVRPGSLTNPSEIAAAAIGYLAMTNNDHAEYGYCDMILPGVDPGTVARLSGLDWTMDHTARDTAVKAGISPTIVEDGAVLFQNVVSFYRPATIPVRSNAFRSMRNISIIQNILAAMRTQFRSEKWQQFTVVRDVKNVTNAGSRAKARDVDSVKDDLLALIYAFAGRGWLYDPDYSIAALRGSGAVSVREDGSGFDSQVPFVLSGEGLILDTIAYLDASVAVVA